MFGLLALAGYEQVLQLGEALTAQGRVSPWLGIWMIFAGFGAAAGFLFFRASFRVTGDPFAGLSNLVASGAGRLTRLWRQAAQ